MSVDGPLPFVALADFLQTNLAGHWQLSCGLPLPKAPPRSAAVGAFLRFEGMLAPRQRFELWLDAPLALAVVDRALGGAALPDAPGGHRAGALNEAELGVLAYVAARALRELGAPVRLSEIASEPSPAEPHTVTLPLAIQVDGVAAAAHVHVAAEVCTRFGPALPVAWVVAAEPGELGDLQAGDVVLTEGTGLGRGGWLHVEGLEGCLPVERADESGSFRARLGPQPAADAVWLETPAGSLDLAALAALQTPGTAPVQLAVNGSEAWLRQAGGRVAEGELVTLRGCTGLRIQKVCARRLTPGPTQYTQ